MKAVNQVASNNDSGCMTRSFAQALFDLSRRSM
jgi:hypothetical protein